MNTGEWHWFHCTTHTYGAWLYGDPRGFRTRHHREHIEGDYKNPLPPGTYDKQLQQSHKLLKQPPVNLAPEWRPVFGMAFRDKLQQLGAQVLCFNLGNTHVHVLAKMPIEPVPRNWIGQAKMYSNMMGKKQGWTGKLWAVRCKAARIRDRQHQLNTFQYILDHVREGAWIWDFRNGL